MVGKGQDIQVNEKLQTFLEINGQVEDIVRKDLVFPYGKSSGRIGELVSWNFFYCWNHCTRSMLMMKFSTQPLSKILNITPERYDELIDDVRKEMPEYETFARTTRVYGRKKN